ncbi:MAG: transketolase [Calditrichia bacterium]
MSKLDDLTIEELSINTIRTLAMDAVQKADSGHPGTPMALAPLAYVLWKKIMRYNPKNPHWLNRDRFILSAGHASMLQYASLFLSGYDLSLEDIKNFRQWGSITPGHPEYDETPGIETTTGPLGQGFLNGVGMAIAEAHLSARYNRDDFPVIDHFTYVICSDGDLMEGASHEAASLAGHLKLGKMIYFYDDNHISIEGKTGITYSDNVPERFKAYNWHVQDLGENANDIEKIEKAIHNAQSETERPSLIILRSHIAWGAPNMQDTPEAHGSPLGEEEIRKTKEFYGWPADQQFLVPEKALQHMRESVGKGRELEEKWRQLYDRYKEKFSDEASRLQAAIEGKMPQGWEKDLPQFKPEDGPMATRGAAGKVINKLAERLFWIMGGSADLAPSTKTLIDSSGYFEAGGYENRNMAWGVREHAMCGAASGIMLHEGVRPFVSTFFVFTDYARPSIRLASIMKLPVIYVMTHDSIGLGEDGPTHQPVEHLASLRAMPAISLIRPADANETAYAWQAALQNLDGPTILVLSRQKLPVFDRQKTASAEGVLKGAYVLSKENSDQPQAILISSGSEVQLILDAQQKLQEQGIDVRCVSMPSWELFRRQPEEYRNQVLPPQVSARVAVEAGSPQGWEEWCGCKGAVIGLTRFGASAPYKEIYKHLGFTPDNIADKVNEVLKNQ